MEESSRGRSTTRSMSMVIDAPLPDVHTILSEFNQTNLDSQTQRIVAEIKKISDFQKESIQEILAKAQAMVTDLIWQRDQLIAKVKEECSTRAIELKSIINSYQAIDNTRRASKILKPLYNQPIINFHREILFIKHNWLQKNTVSVNFSENGLEKILSCRYLSQQLSNMYDEASEASTVTQLILNRKLGDDGARHISHILPFYPNLCVLSLTSNCLGPRGGKFIAAGLSYLPKLYKFSINSDRIKDGIVSLARVLPCLKNLEEVYLSTGLFYEREASDIGISLSFMSRLKNLSLLGGVLEIKGSERICQGLIFLSQINTLDLSGSSLGPGGTEVICRTLSLLKKIQCLKLSANNIGSEGGEHIGRVLKSLKALDELWLNSNSLGDQGVNQLFSYSDVQLRVLTLQDNGLTNFGAKIVLEKSKNWPDLQTLDLSWNAIDNQIAEAFKETGEKFANATMNFCGMNLNEKILNSFGFTVLV
jgi:Leucine Rich repeat